MLSVKLVVVGGDAKSKEVQLNLPTVIGRGREGVSLTLPHKLVSRKHTELFEDQGQLFVRDLGSLNGTYVNNERISDSQPLKPNELLTLGNVTFRAIYDSGSIDPPPMAPKFQEVQSSEDVLDEAPEGESDTGKSLPEVNAADLDELDALDDLGVDIDSSDIFSGPAIEGATPEKSISMSAIGGLPTGNKNSDFDMHLDGVDRPDPVKRVEIELDAPAKSTQPEDSKLGSFLKKLPR
ncbi:FHA domain-containing protein [Mariniblastus fucicola]|uniref:FHA domain protein n=1 Tax=Mariniblastus fucicola TaxID=980251 RepID=A0A5B9P2M3_9BACT|nr:FHA domain-containing protein [Mariniblastus fucicola]QEG20598.1 FHA domain protein [Mariniblastus fucicola]